MTAATVDQPRRVALDPHMPLVDRDGKYYLGRVLGTWAVRKATDADRAQFTLVDGRWVRRVTK